MSKIQFDYHYGVESEKFEFYRIPRLLFTDDYFQPLSCEAKLLYGLMLDRMALSLRNGWVDEQNRAYIYFTLEDVMEYLRCGKDKGVKILAELDTERGIGLIERVKQGMGKPTIIYVKTFLHQEEQPEKSELPEGNSPAPEELQSDSVEMAADSAAEVKTSEKPKSRLLKNRSQDFRKAEVKTSEKPKSRVPENRSQDFGKTDWNYTDKSYTDLSYTDMSKKESIHPSEPAGEDALPGTDAMDTIKALRQQVRQNIDYDHLVSEGGYFVRKYAPEIYRLICDIVCIPQKVVRIAGADCPYPLVRERFLQLTGEDIEYVVECMSRTSGRIGSIRAYLLTALYNAPASREHFYRAETSCKVRQDGGVAAFEAFAAKDS